MDVDIFHFYHVVLCDEMLFFNVSEQRLRKSFIVLKRAYNRKALKKCKAYVDYHLPAERSAYIYKFGPCHTQLASVYFRRFLENARHVYSTLEKKDELKICCLGGGPGTDVVGLFNVLVSYEDLWSKLSEVTVLDICGGWRNSFKRIIQKLKETYPVQENLLTSLISVDLMETLSAPALKAVEEADIICMVKFVSTVISHPSAESAFKELASHMKTGAVVIFIDNLDNRIFKPLKKYFSESGLKCVFRDFCDKFKVQGSYSVDFKDLDGSETMEYANVYVLGWIKLPAPELASIYKENFGTLQNASCIDSNKEEFNYQKSDDASDSDSLHSDFLVNKDGCNNFSCDDVSSNVDREQFSPNECTPQELSNYLAKNSTTSNCRGSSSIVNVDEKKLCVDQCTQTIEELGRLSNYLMKNDVCNNFIADRTKLYTDQCTQTKEKMGGLFNYLVKNEVCDNLNSNELPCNTDRTKLYIDQCSQTVNVLCDESPTCSVHKYLESMESHLSTISTRLSRIELLIKNTAVGCSKKYCGIVHCDNFLGSNISDKCHCYDHNQHRIVNTVDTSAIHSDVQHTPFIVLPLRTVSFNDASHFAMPCIP